MIKYIINLITISQMKTIEKSPSTSLLQILANAINESIAMDNIKESDLIYSERNKFSDESVNLVHVINIPNIYPSDSVEHIEKNSSNFDRIISDFTEFLIGRELLLSESFPLLIHNGEGQESILINISDYNLHIYYHENGQY